MNREQELHTLICKVIQKIGITSMISNNIDTFDLIKESNEILTNTIILKKYLQELEDITN